MPAYSISRPFSYSSLNVFERCPAKYKLYYLDGIVKPQDSIEAFLGRRVHETMEFLYKQVKTNGPPLFDTVLEDFHYRWENEWHSDLVFVNQFLSVADYYDLGIKCLAWYYRKYHPFNEPVVELEAEMLFIIGNDDKYKFKGIADRIEDHGDGVWEIHDYKTSKRALTQRAADKDRQLSLYHMGLLQNKENVKEVRLVWHFMRVGITVRSMRDNDQLHYLTISVQKTINKITETMENGGPFPAVQTPLCNWCYYWVECPAKTRNNPFVKS